MTLNELRDWHARMARTMMDVPADEEFHRHAVICLNYAIRDWDKNAAREEAEQDASDRRSRLAKHSGEIIAALISAAKLR